MKIIGHAEDLHYDINASIHNIKATIDHAEVMRYNRPSLHSTLSYFSGVVHGSHKIDTEYTQITFNTDGLIMHM